MEENYSCVRARDGFTSESRGSAARRTARVACCRSRMALEPCTAGLSGATLLNGIARPPFPFFLFCVPPNARIHDSRLNGFDHKDRRLLLADQQPSYFHGIKRHIDQDKLGFWRGRVPCILAVAKDDQQIVTVLRISSETRSKPRISHAKVSMVRIGHLILEAERVWYWIFTVGDDCHIFHAVAVKVSGNGHRRKLGRQGKRGAELLLDQRFQLRRIRRSRSCGRHRRSRLRSLHRLRYCDTRHQ